MKDSINTLRLRAGRIYRRATARGRALPAFIIAGTQKGGTSSLYSWLAAHPQVRPALTKEVHYFDNGYAKGPGWYRAQFPIISAGPSRGHGCITGEASPYYMFHPHAPARIVRDLPGVRIIILLRNPVERAYSHYQMAIRSGRETLAFEDAVAAEPERLAPEIAKMAADPAYRSTVHQQQSYVSRGIYADQLTALFRHFEHERVLILKSEALFAEPQATFDRVTRFLDLPALDLGEPPARNVGNYAPEIPGRAGLEAFFAPHNQRLYAMPGVDFSW